MGFFSKLFGGKKTEKPKIGNRTNPAQNQHKQATKPITKDQSLEMPKITFRKMPDDAPMTDHTLAGKMRIDIILAMAAMTGKDKAYKEEGILYDALVKDGIIRIPLVVSKKGKNYGVFAFYNAEEAKHFKKFRKTLIEEAGFEDCYYLSSVDPEQFSVSDGEIETGISFAGLFRLEEKPEEKDFEGQYAMWWTDDKAPLFSDSPAANYYKDIYTSLSGYESFFCGLLMAGLHNKELSRTRLPKADTFFYTTGPNNKKCVIALSEEKGVRFLFPDNKVSIDYLHTCLKIIATSFVFLRKGFENQGIEAEAISEVSSLKWYKHLYTSIQNGEIIARELERLTIGNPEPEKTKERTINPSNVLFRVKVGDSALAIHTNSKTTETEIPDAQKPVFLDFQENFILGLAQDMGYSYEFINSDMLSKSSFTKEELLDTGKANILNEIKEQIKIVGNPNSECVMITCGGNHESALIVYDAFWDQVGEMVQSDFCMALPVRDILLVCNFYNTEALEVMRQKIRQFY